MKTYEKYKDSGVDWIGDVPEHWEVRKLKRVCQVKRGASPRPIDSPKYFDDNGEFGWVRISDVTRSERYLEETQQYLSKLGTQCSVKMYPNDIFLSIAGSVGKAIITKVKCCIHDGFVWFKGLKIDTEFLYYIFQISRIYEGLGKEGTQLNLNTETIGSVIIPFISISEQQKIASYLDKKLQAIDQLIKNKESLISLLEEEKKAIITKAVTKGLDKNVKLKNSGADWIGDIPEHWKVVKLKYLLKFDTGGTPSTKNMSYFEGDNIWLSIGDLGDKFVYKSKNMITDKAIRISRMNTVKKDSLLYSFKLSIGIMAFAGCDLYTNEAIASFPIEKNKNLNFWYYVLPSFIEKNANENIYDAKLLNQFLMKNAFLINPPFLEQQEIVTYLDEQTKKIDDLKAKYRQEIDLIKEYKERLIYDVVTGKINVMQE